MSADNPFFDYTITSKLYWRKNEQGNYEYLETPVIRGEGKTHVARLESIEVTGIKDALGRTGTVSVGHIDFRIEKTMESAVNKLIRKGLDSPKEILDTRGFRFVVETEEDAWTLLDILAYNLSSGPETAWSQKPKWEKNEASGTNFRCLK